MTRRPTTSAYHSSTRTSCPRTIRSARRGSRPPPPPGQGEAPAGARGVHRDRGRVAEAPARGVSGVRDVKNNRILAQARRRLGVASACGDGGGGVAVVGRRRVGAGREQQLDHPEVAGAGGAHQRRRPSVVAKVDGRSLRQQKGDGVGVPVARRPVKRSVPDPPRLRLQQRTVRSEERAVENPRGAQGGVRGRALLFGGVLGASEGAGVAVPPSPSNFFCAAVGFVSFTTGM